MRTPAILLSLLLSTLPAFSQKEIKGRILDSHTRDPIPSATVTLHPAGSQEILAYAVTADDGTFSLRRAAMPDTVDIAIRSMTIEPQSKRVASDAGFVEFLAQEKKTALKEVIVKAPKIRQTGDTISYSVSSFTDATDRSIGDVLKKLPGIQVLPSGQITYQDKPISKFYVEGLDMLQGKYGVITQNVDADKVATVQVLENHQPIKALKDMEIPEAAAINLKLKDSARGAFFATAQAGVGVPDLLLSNELVGMRFTRTQQNMLVYKGDNTGRDVAQELVSFYGDANKLGNSFLSVQMPSPPNIKAQHYLDNDAHTVSLNDLRMVGKDVTLTGNLSFIHDRQKSRNYSRQDVFLQNEETIRIEEEIDARLLKRELEGGLTLEKNTSDCYLNNKFNVQTKWSNRNSEALHGSAESVWQHLKLPEIQLSNDFEWLRKKGKRHHRMGAYVGYVSQEPSLRVAPSTFAPLLADVQDGDSLLMQDVSYSHLSTRAFLSGGWDKKVYISYRATVFSDHYRMQSDLYAGLARHPLAADSLRNDFRRNETGVRGSTDFQFNFSPKFKPYLSLPVTFLRVNRNDKARGTDNNKHYVLFSPSLNVHYSVTSRISLFSSMLYSKRIGGINEDYLGYIMNTYRGMNRNDGLESKKRAFDSYVRLRYKNPFTTFFSTISLSYSNVWGNLLRDVRYDGMLSSNTGIHHPNTTHSFGVHYSLGKSVDVIRSEVKLSAGYNENRSKAMNQEEIADIRNRSYSVSPSIVTDIGKFMIIKYDATYSRNRSKIESDNMPAVNRFTQNISASVIPVKKLVLNVSANHYYNDGLESSSRSSWFANAGLKYRLKRTDLLLDWTNIFDTREFATFSYSSAYSYYSTYRLRPAEVLLRVRFKLF